MDSLPHTIGLHGIYTYFPSRYVSQSKCEEYDGVSAGKYTRGLGQEQMAVADPKEDIISMSLTACTNLMERHGLEPKDIGRIEVGTETLVDKSKSVKTHWMERFNEEGCYDVLGIDTLNACYGGTSAFFNAVNWMESSMWNGKYAIVLTGDIAIYEPGPARPTGGAGMVAMLIGPDAPIVLESETVCSHFEHAYDFYKPNMTSEYPVVDGPLSNACYTRAIASCYERFRTRIDSRFDYALLHAPYQKLVRKAFHQVYMLEEPKSTDLADSEDEYINKVEPGLTLSRTCGNMYTGSVWASLNALLCNETFNPTIGSRVMMFSYGSGFASSMFSMRIRNPDGAKQAGVPFQSRLNDRFEIPPSDFHDLVNARENGVGTKTKTMVAPGTFVRSAKDSLGRRSYQRSSCRMIHTLLRRLKR